MRMAIYAIIIDADKISDALKDVLKAVDSVQAYPHLWFVCSQEGTQTLTMQLGEKLGERDRLYVCSVSDDWVSIRTPHAAAWLNARGL